MSAAGPIAVLCPTVWGYRNVVDSGVLNRLEAAGARVHVLLGEFGQTLPSDPQRRIRNCAALRAAPVIRSQSGKAARNALLQASFARRHGLTAPAILSDWQNRDKGLRQRLRDSVVELLSVAGSRQPFYGWQVSSEERFFERTHDLGAVTAHLAEIAPKLLVSTHCTVAAERPYILAARRLGIPTAGWILSFDNLTSRSVVPLFDHYLAWNARMRGDVLRLYPDRDPATVNVTGTPQFDFHVDAAYRSSRAETLRELGLPPGGRYLLWAANSRVFTPTEPELVAAFLRRTQDDADLRERRIVVRLHPLDDYERWADPQRRDPRLAVVRPWERTGPPPGPEAQTRLVSTLAHADVCINVASTMSLDAAVLDVPVVCVAFALGESGREHDACRAYYRTEHYRPIVASGGVAMAHTLDDLVRLAGEAVRDPGRSRAARAQLVRDECGQTDGAAGVRVAAALAKLAGLGEGAGFLAGEADPGRRAGGLARSSSRRAAAVCGIAGFWSGSDSAEPAAAARRMGERLRHRGPDDSGEWVDREAGIGLAFRRLSILDLSAEGHQPMRSPSGRYVLVFNGEIYNWQELRQALEAVPGAAPRFRGHSDTEVLLHAVERWGLEETLRRSVGMFAFGLWDREEKALHLARDRMGEKPLYYGWSGRVFLFGSELKALRAHPAWRGEVDRESLDLLVRYDFVPAPWSIYAGIFKLLPGTVLSLKEGETEPRCRPYWSAREVYEAGSRDPFRGTEREAEAELESLLRRSVGQQMVADVPLGALLSGGYDSSLIVALMQSQSPRPIRTFTIGFPDPRMDESGYARRVAEHLGTAHTELHVGDREALAVVPRLPSIYDEPFGDASQIPTFLVMQLARRDVTVCLSGDGGDELFGGYGRYVSGGRAIAATRRLPGAVRGAVTGLVEGALRLGGPPEGGSASDLSRAHTRHRLWNVVSRLGASSQEAMYHAASSRWKEPGSPVAGVAGNRRPLVDTARWARLSGLAPMMMYQDAVGYLPDDILVKVDRASMAVSLEARAPYLDHRVVEFAARLPLSLKIRAGRAKFLPRQVLYRHVPAELVDRPKRGFGPPIAEWLRGAFREWTESLLSEERLRSEGYFSAPAMRRIWRQHLAGSSLWTSLLWNVVMFQAWLDEGESGSAAAAGSERACS